MDFDLPGEDDPRRRAVRDWCRAHPAPTGLELAQAGYVVPHWPPPWGLAAEPELLLIIDSELERAGISRPVNPVAINNCGISLVEHGSRAQQDRYLWPALSGDEIWCQLFSEPGAGSDLASLRTQARREGDDYVVNGSKIWTSLAHEARVGVLVARTDPDAPKHRGLSTFIVDMHSPGIEVRPIEDMTGFPNEYNQVFFTDVRIPATNRVGAEGDGWKVTVAQLQTERVALAKPGAIWGTGPSARDLVADLHAAGALANPVVRQQAAALYIEGEILRLLKYRNLSDRLLGRPIGPESAVQKALSAPHGQRVMAMALEHMGPRGLVREAEPFADTAEAGMWTYGHMGPRGLVQDAGRPATETGRGTWNYGIWFSPGVTLGIGTTEVMKNQIAERLLGMPREEDPDVRRPWKDTLARGKAV